MVGYKEPQDINIFVCQININNVTYGLGWTVMDIEKGERVHQASTAACGLCLCFTRLGLYFDKTYQLRDRVAFPDMRRVAGPRLHSANPERESRGAVRLKRNLRFKVIYKQRGEIIRVSTYVQDRFAGFRLYIRRLPCLPVVR